MMQATIARFVRNFSMRAKAAALCHPLEVVVGVAVALFLSAGIESVVERKLVAALAVASVPALMMVFGATYLQRLGAIGLGARLVISLASLGLWGWWGWGMSQEYLEAEAWRVGL